LDDRAHPQFSLGVLKIGSGGMPGNAENPSDLPGGFPTGGFRIHEVITTRRQRPDHEQLASGMCVKIHSHELANVSMLFNAARKGWTGLIRRESECRDCAPAVMDWDSKTAGDAKPGGLLEYGCLETPFKRLGIFENLNDYRIKTRIGF
jgi:hypothetical protein